MQQRPKQIEKPKSHGTYTLITGATSGIGKVIADQLATAGLNLTLCARSQNTLYTIAAEYRDCIEVITMPVDLSNGEQVQYLFINTKALDIGTSQTVHPGTLTKVPTYSLHLLPSFAKIKIMTAIMKKWRTANISYP
ncbi:MAG: SDR family NAD(P)-dependent oxidoreductase [Saonia sp.]